MTRYILLTLALSLALVVVACKAEPLADPISDASPISIHDSAPPKINDYMAEPAMLVFSKTREWRHEEGIAGGNLFFNRLAAKMGYGILTTQNGAIFNARDLARFKVVIFNSATGDILSEAQEAALQKWVEDGGALIAIHGAGDNSHQGFPWYQDNVLGTLFISHPMAPQFQAADVHSLAPEHPVMAGIPDIWSHVEEWYTFDRVPGEGFTILAGIDEDTYSPVSTVYGDVSDLRMGPEPSDHPIIWSRCISDGRSVYSALGHQDTAFEDAVHQQLLENAVNWVTKTTDVTGEHC